MISVREEPATIQKGDLVAEEFLRFQDVTSETLTWTRPNFFALRYELSCPSGMLARIRVEGIGLNRIVAADSADGTCILGVFPLDRHEVPISVGGQPEPIARYYREEPVEVRFQDGRRYQFRLCAGERAMFDADEDRGVFTVEQAEYFPRWSVDLKLEPSAQQLTWLPVLLFTACCVLVFDSNGNWRIPALHQAAVQQSEISEPG